MVTANEVEATVEVAFQPLREDVEDLDEFVRLHGKTVKQVPIDCDFSIAIPDQLFIVVPHVLPQGRLRRRRRPGHALNTNVGVIQN